MINRGTLMVVSGPAGVGKGSVCKKFLKDNPEVKLSVSATTRSPRPGEKNGREYFFLSKEEFEEKIRTDNLLEYVTFVDNYYGTLKSAVEEKLVAGEDVLLEIEIEGAMNVKKKSMKVFIIWQLKPKRIQIKPLQQFFLVRQAIIKMQKKEALLCGMKSLSEKQFQQVNIIQ